MSSVCKAHSHVQSRPGPPRSLTPHSLTHPEQLPVLPALFVVVLYTGVPFFIFYTIFSLSLFYVWIHTYLLSCCNCLQGSVRNLPHRPGAQELHPQLGVWEAAPSRFVLVPLGRSHSEEIARRHMSQNVSPLLTAHDCTCTQPLKRSRCRHGQSLGLIV